MRNLFNSVYVKPVKRNPFGFHFPVDFTTDYGNITPCLIFDTYAGEIFKMSNESFVRTQPLRAPAFMTADVSYHYFFVPHRLVYDDWKDFIVRGRDGNTIYDKPYCTIKDMYGGDDMHPVNSFLTSGSLFDFLNFPSFSLVDFESAAVDAKSHKVDMMPFNAYNLIYNEYYRDENLQPEVYIWSQSGRADNVQDFSDYQSEVSTEWGDPSAQLFVVPWILRKRCWRKDYFTSALPWMQKGPQISFSANSNVGGDYVPVRFMIGTWQQGDPSKWFLGIRNVGSNPGDTSLWAFDRTAGTTGTEGHVHLPYSGTNELYSRNAVAYINLPEFQQSVMTISDFRLGLALSQWFELDARTGSDRYFEYLLGHFGVRDKDSRLQRPEYIGGYSHSIQISEVEQTSSSDNVTPQGNLAGRGLGYSVNTPLKYRCPEPGWILCLQSIRPHAIYYQGWPRMYTRWDSFDYYDPLFDHLSEKAIKSSELFYNPRVEPGSSSDPDFGYTPQFSEYRWMPGQVHGDMRESYRYWATPRSFDTPPRLTSNFIMIDGYREHLYDSFAFIGSAADPAPHFICHVVHHIKAIRPMSKYATPH